MSNSHDEKAEIMESDIFGANDSDSSPIDESLSNLIQKLGQDDDVDFFTDLSQDEIRHITVLSLRNDETTKRFLKKYKDLQVSRRRKGRKELIEVAKAIGSLAKEQEEKAKGRLGGLI